MKTHFQLSHRLVKTIFVMILSFTVLNCNRDTQEPVNTVNGKTKTEQADYFHLRPELEKMYGFTQAVRIGNTLKIGGVISIDAQGKPLAKEDYLQQMKNCYSSIEKVLKHYGCTFDDVYLENIFTTSMADLQKNAAFRQEIYKNHFPTGSWIGIRELGLPEVMIEIEIEALLPER